MRGLRFLSRALLVVSLISSAPRAAGAFCFEEAATLYGVAPALLHAVAEHESGLVPFALNTGNATGSFDVGLRQVNSSWAATLGSERWQAVWFVATLATT